METHWPPDVPNEIGTELERRPESVQDLFHSPESLLASLFIDEKDHHRLVFLTGPSGSGKTSWCLELVNSARSLGFTIAGLVSPAAFVNGRKVGIDLVDLSSGERRRLAFHRGLPVDKHHALITGPVTGDWQFDSESLQWGVQVLECVGENDLFILDEVGPLEFYGGQGWSSGLRGIDLQRHRLAIVVVRPPLIPKAKERWPWGQVVWVSAKEETRKA